MLGVNTDYFVMVNLNNVLICIVTMHRKSYFIFFFIFNEFEISGLLCLVSNNQERAAVAK